MTTSVQARVMEANRALVDAGLVVLTWGNASALDRATGRVIIKPSGVAYDRMNPADMVEVDLATGREDARGKRPSSDLPTHLELYRAWPTIGAVVHTHSTYATAFAQAERPLSCFGTTHADHFCGEVPVTRRLRPAEIDHDYERNTGRAMVECFEKLRLDPLQMPGVLVAGHGPFTWGQTLREAVDNAIAIEAVAQMALATLQLAPDADSIPTELLERHFARKHGPNAYYGQPSAGGKGERRGRL